MDLFTQGQCKTIFDKFCKSPPSVVIQNVQSDFSLDSIETKLKNNKYISTFDFFLDFLFLFDSCSINLSERNKLVLNYGRSYITKKILNLPRSQDEIKYIKFTKLQHQLQIVLSSIFTGEFVSPKELLIQHAKLSQKPPGRANLHLKTVESLQHRIEHLKKPEELKVIFKILQQYIPDLNLSSQVVINCTQIPKNCLEEIKSYLNSINA